MWFVEQDVRYQLGNLESCPSLAGHPCTGPATIFVLDSHLHGRLLYETLLFVKCWATQGKDVFATYAHCRDKKTSSGLAHRCQSNSFCGHLHLWPLPEDKIWLPVYLNNHQLLYKTHTRHLGHCNSTKIWLYLSMIGLDRTVNQCNY